jgi:acetylornithine deacetylase/succinyl-diaminopimelate desuccinylase-like protein
MERVVGARFPGIPITPYMETGATDAVWSRNAGIPSFGVAGFFIPSEDQERVHGRDERISLKAFEEMVSFSERLLREVANR